MAMLFAYAELAASLFILLLAFQIWTRHYENKLARFYALFAGLSFLAAILTYSLRIAFTLELAADINRISGSLWAFIFALYLHFVLLFTRKERFFKNPFSLWLLYLPPVLISSLFLFTNLMYQRYEIQSIGIVSIPASLYLLFLLETALFCFLGIGFLANYSFVAPQKKERLQARLIAIGSIIPVIIGLINDMLLPIWLNVRLTPPSVIFDVAIMNLFIYLAMRNYSLFAISPSLAAETIIETMPDSLIVTDLDGQIIFVNDEAQKFFHVPKEEVAGHCIANLFKDKAKYEKLYIEVVNKKLVVELYEAEMINPLGEHIPALINARLLREKHIGETIGIVFVVRDIRG
jgi:PAS domain S-box-containing protein